MIRARPTRWFELLVARDDTTLALEALAATGAVELETRSAGTLPEGFAELRPLLAQFSELALRVHPDRPPHAGAPSAVPEAPLQTISRCLELLRTWTRDAEEPIRRLQHAQAESARVQRWQQVIAQLAGSPIDLGLAARAGPRLAVRLLCGNGSEPLAPASGGPASGVEGPLLRPLQLGDAAGWLAVGTPQQLEAPEQQVLAQKGEVLAPPPWLGSDTGQNALAARREIARLQAEQAEAGAAIESLNTAHDLAHVLADIHRLQWVLDNVRGLEAGALLCWITGWTSAADGQPLEQAIERSGARALLRLASPPPGKLAPLQLHNPAWVRPFEVFSRAMGMPGGDEADPSVLLALAVPLMFGYMFGDVGQGLVIAAVGFALRGRFALARLFISGGLSAALFGLLFGSVFSWHGLPALWVQPLDDPLAVLIAPLLGGALLLGIGLLLSALGAYWRADLGRWLATDGGLLAAFAGLLAGLAWPPGFAVATAGALLFCAGHGWQARRPAAALAALGEFVERLVQLLINTLSFARVGAFALAHAGLSSAIVALADAADHPVAVTLVMIVGNAVVIVLEGLVVSIQTTRLVLFEFFARFLQGTGRVFRPLPLPPSALRET